MMGKKVLAAKSGRAACSCAPAGGGVCSVGVFNAEKQSSREAKSFLTGLTGFTGLRETSVKPAKTKPSGVAWIGDIPEGWEVGRLQRHLEEIVVKNNPIQTTKVLSLTNDKGVIPYSEKGNVGNKAKEDYSEYKLAYRDTIVANSMNILIGSVGLSKYDGCVSPVYYVFKARTGSSIHYFNYLFQLHAFQKELRRYANGILEIRLRVSSADILKRPVAMPPLPVQRAIAAYLDEKCGAIDAAIAEAKKGIEEYKAWKKSLIFEVVTGKRRVGFFNAESKCARDEVVGLPERSEPEGPQGAARRRVAESFSTGLTRFTGLGENLDNPVNPVKTKPSGIPWIGDVPEGWKVSRVKLHYELILGKMLCSTSNNDANVRLPYVCAANVHFEGVALSDLKEMWFSTIEVKQYAIREGDLLVVEGGAGAGGAAICPRIDGIVGIQNSIILVRNKRCRDNRYLRYLLEALVKNGYVDFVCNKATIPHFTKDKLGNVPLPLPPLSEQQAIAAYLDEKCAAIDAMIAEKEALIAELEAYKKSLIYEVVTGKREVL